MRSAARRSPASAPHLPFPRKLYGLGSVFGKTLRDARLGMLVVAGLLGVMTLAGGMTMSSTYGTAETRLELAAMSGDMPPMMRGLYGNPVNVDTLGGFISWHYGTYFALFAGLWSLLALSSTLASEARRGSLEFAVATPSSRRSIALQKLAGHVAAVGVAMALLVIVAWATGVVGSTFPGDAITPAAAISFASGSASARSSPDRSRLPSHPSWAVARPPGSLARSCSAATSSTATGPSCRRSKRCPAPPGSPGPSDHLPLAGQSDWPGIAVTALLAVGLLAIGVEAFARRDVGVTISLPLPGLPRVLLGVRGPWTGRSETCCRPPLLGHRSRRLRGPDGGRLAIPARHPRRIARDGRDLPHHHPRDRHHDRGGIPAAGVRRHRLRADRPGGGNVHRDPVLGRDVRAGWSSSSPRRSRGCAGPSQAPPPSASPSSWSTVLLAVGVGVGVASVGQDVATPSTGTLVLAVYGAALAGIGVAVAGLFRASVAMPVVLAVTIGTFLVDLVAPVLRLPDWVQQLALTAHLGEPMVGTWDAAGVAACLVLAVGGVVIGAWGMSRRDIGT